MKRFPICVVYLATIAFVDAFLSGCSRMNKGVESTPEIRFHVRLLASELPMSQLGSIVPMETTNTQFLVAQGELAVPLLVESLREADKSMMVGYAAF